MRLDKYLKMTRLIKRRTVSNKACDAGKIIVNNSPAKPSYIVKIDDIIDICIGKTNLKVKVVDIPKVESKETSINNYVIIN
ncbi:MAG: RNA-binding S4 domain-containing protein [Oscillospiraceae bacterium]|nr:RNA-binding S4 domain-containing protein [Oscillospiraceae bacterium]